MMENCLAILDVGHGLSVVLQTRDGVGIIDGGRGDTLRQYLRSQGIRQIDWIVLTHSDVDHLAGLNGLMEDDHFKIGRIYANPDGAKGSQAWDDFAWLAHVEGPNKGLRPKSVVSCDISSELRLGKATIEVLAPHGYIATKSAGGKDRQERNLTSNSMSAVVRILWEGQPVANVTGDLDDVGLANLLELGGIGKPPWSAAILVFPHHGGRPGGADPTTFTSKLMSALPAKIVVFSNGRDPHDHPMPEVVAAVLKYGGKPAIACTQLARACSAEIVKNGWAVSEYESAGRLEERSCAGTIAISLDSPLDESYGAQAKRHEAWIRSNIAGAVCKM